MIIYKDAFTGDELFSDTFPIELLDGVVYKVKGKLTTETYDIDERAIGGNASAEGGGDEGSEAASKQGVDIVLCSRLVEYAMKKKDYMVHIKTYMKEVKEKLEKEKPAEVDVFQKNVQNFVKEVVGKFDDYQLFCGENMKPEGMMALMKWDGETPYMFFFKHGLEEEKV